MLYDAATAAKMSDDALRGAQVGLQRLRRAVSAVNPIQRDLTEDHKVIVTEMLRRRIHPEPPLAA